MQKRFQNERYDDCRMTSGVFSTVSELVAIVDEMRKKPARMLSFEEHFDARLVNLTTTFSRRMGSMP